MGAECKQVLAPQTRNDASQIRCEARRALSQAIRQQTARCATADARRRAGRYARVDREPIQLMNTLELLREFVKKHADNPPENITLDSKLLEIGIDSLNLLELLFEAEEKFGIRFPNDLPQPETVGQLIEIFDKLQKAKTQA
jgi:acyl carrier protein